MVSGVMVDRRRYTPRVPISLILEKARIQEQKRLRAGTRWYSDVEPIKPTITVKI